MIDDSLKYLQEQINQAKKTQKASLDQARKSIDELEDKEQKEKFNKLLSKCKSGKASFKDVIQAVNGS